MPKDRLKRGPILVGRAMADLRRYMAWRYLGGRSRMAKRMAQLSGEQKWCFVVGCNNSGTTLVHDILARQYGFSAMKHEGQRYTRALPRAARRGHERVWSEFIGELRLTEMDSMSPVPQMLFDWSGELQQPLQRVVLEKTTANAVRMRWLQKAFSDSYFIGVVRNGYAVVEGIKRKGKKNVRRGAKHWNLVNKIMMEDAHYVDRFLLMQYEELTSSPQNALNKMLLFLGANEDKELNRRGSSDNQELLAPFEIQNMNEACIGRLDDTEMSIIGSEAHEMLEYFGYALPRRKVAEREVVQGK